MIATAFEWIVPGIFDASAGIDSAWL